MIWNLPSVISFKEMAKTCASNWKEVDAETKSYCDSVAKIQKIRYKELLKAFHFRRRTVSMSVSTLNQPWFGFDLHMSPTSSAQNLYQPAPSSSFPQPALPFQEATQTHVPNQGYARVVGEQKSDSCSQEIFSSSQSGERATTLGLSFDAPQPDELVSEQHEESLYCKLTSDSEVHVSDSDIINAWLTHDEYVGSR